jgi:hypothetical protein
MSKKQAKRKAVAAIHAIIKAARELAQAEQVLSRGDEARHGGKPLAEERPNQQAGGQGVTHG